MGARHPNPRLVKVNRTYSIEQLGTLFNVHPNTVRAWRHAGLTTIDQVKPMLFRGAHVAAFLRQRKLSGKRPCKPGQIYCLPCRAPKIPALGIADFVPLNETIGDLQGLCPDCDRLMHRRVIRAELGAIAGSLEVDVRMQDND
jgi:hypothetical protein